MRSRNFLRDLNTSIKKQEVKFFSRNLVEYFIHVLIWGAGYVLILLYAQTIGTFNRSDGTMIVPVTYGVISNLILFYGNALILIPKLIPGKRHKRYIRSVLILFLTVTLVESLVDYYFSISIYSTEVEPLGAVIIINTLINGLILSFSIGYGFIKNWIINETQKQKLEKEKLFAELNYLKNQVNPHFLFNSLNMAYASSLKSDDQATAEIIEKLSGLMRYNLYESNEEKVELVKEIAYIKDYIDLQLKRVSDVIRKHILIEIAKEPAQAMIAPLLLIPFIENVFKHGILLSNPKPIEISLKLENNLLIFFTRNGIRENGTGSEYGGIGIKNARARLKLIYPKKHNLEISRKDGMYLTRLEIEL